MGKKSRCPECGNIQTVGETLSSSGEPARRKSASPPPLDVAFLADEPPPQLDRVATYHLPSSTHAFQARAYSATAALQAAGLGPRAEIAAVAQEASGG